MSWPAPTIATHEIALRRVGLLRHLPAYPPGLPGAIVDRHWKRAQFLVGAADIWTERSVEKVRAAMPGNATWPAPTIRQHEAYLLTAGALPGSGLLGASLDLEGAHLDDTWRVANKAAVATYHADVRAR